MKKQSPPVFAALLNAVDAALVAHNALVDEKDGLSLRERQARTSLEAATVAPLDSDETTANVHAASITIATLAGRKGNINKSLKPAFDTLCQRLREADRYWTRIVQAERDKWERKFWEATEPFYPGWSRREMPQPQDSPAWDQFGRSMWNLNGARILQMNHANARSTVASFTALLKANLQKFDLTILDNQPTP